jgi:hypothetical protein
MGPTSSGSAVGVRAAHFPNCTHSSLQLRCSTRWGLRHGPCLSPKKRELK